jgi:hypothetical protein
MPDHNHSSDKSMKRQQEYGCMVSTGDDGYARQPLVEIQQQDCFSMKYVGVELYSFHFVCKLCACGGRHLDCSHLGKQTRLVVASTEVEAISNLLSYPCISVGTSEFILPSPKIPVLNP